MQWFEVMPAQDLHVHMRKLRRPKLNVLPEVTRSVSADTRNFIFLPLVHCLFS